MTTKASDRHQCIPLKEDVLTDTNSSNWNKNQVTNKLSYTFWPSRFNDIFNKLENHWITCAMFITKLGISVA